MTLLAVGSTLLGLGGAIPLLLLSAKRREGWLIGIALQGAWAIYGAKTGQPGFLISAVIYTSVYLRGFLRSRSA